VRPLPTAEALRLITVVPVVTAAVAEPVPMTARSKPTVLAVRVTIVLYFLTRPSEPSDLSPNVSFHPAYDPTLRNGLLPCS
jgi:hypothetical protein